VRTRIPRLLPGVHGVLGTKRHPAALQVSHVVVELEDELVHSAGNAVAGCPNVVERQAGGVLEGRLPLVAQTGTQRPAAP